MGALFSFFQKNQIDHATVNVRPHVEVAVTISCYSNKPVGLNPRSQVFFIKVIKGFN